MWENSVCGNLKQTMEKNWAGKKLLIWVDWPGALHSTDWASSSPLQSFLPILVAWFVTMLFFSTNQLLGFTFFVIFFLRLGFFCCNWEKTNKLVCSWKLTRISWLCHLFFPFFCKGLLFFEIFFEEILQRPRRQQELSFLVASAR